MQLYTGGAQPRRDHSRAAGQARGGQANSYAFSDRPKIVASDEVIIGIILICHRDVAALFDPKFTYSYGHLILHHIAS